MAVNKITICGNCKRIFSSATKKKCLHCGNKLTGKEVGTSMTIELRMEGRHPTSEEIERLKNVPFKRKPLSEGERKKGITNIAIGIIVSPLLFLFGLWVINSFTGPGVLVFGYGALAVAPIIAITSIGILGINVFIRDPRKKTVAKVFNWIWNESYQNALIDGKESSFDYAYGSALRAIPDTIGERISREALKTYLWETRKTFVRIMGESSKEMDLSFKRKNGVVENARNWKSIYAFQGQVLQLESEEEIENGVCEATGSFTITKTQQRPDGDDTLELDVVAVLVKVHGYYMKNGDYWFPYDLMPELLLSS